MAVARVLQSSPALLLVVLDVFLGGRVGPLLVLDRAEVDDLDVNRLHLLHLGRDRAQAEPDLVACLRDELAVDAVKVGK